MFTQLLVIAATLGLAEAPAPEVAEPEVAEPESEGRWTVQLEFGAAVFTNSRSRTFQHLVRSDVRLEVTARIAPRLSLGVELTGVPSGSSNYRVLAGYVIAKVPVVVAGPFELELGLGFGVGTGPAILASDLRVSRRVIPYVQASLAGRFAVTPWLLIGAEVIYEQLTMVVGVATIAGRF